MTYRLDPNPVFWAAVTVRAPGDEPEAGSFRARFKVLDTEDFGAVDIATPAGTRQLLEEAFVDIDDVIGPDGKRLAFSDAVRETMIRSPHIRAALVAAYLRAFAQAVSGN